MQYEVLTSKGYEDEWRVEAVNAEGDGEVYVAIFSGPEAKERADEYAGWKNTRADLAARDRVIQALLERIEHWLKDAGPNINRPEEIRAELVRRELNAVKLFHGLREALVVTEDRVIQALRAQLAEADALLTGWAYPEGNVPWEATKAFLTGAEPQEQELHVGVQLVEDVYRAKARDTPEAPVVTRFEVIDATGRILVRWPNGLDLSVQDEGRTLKVFLHAVPVVDAQEQRSPDGDGPTTQTPQREAVAWINGLPVSGGNTESVGAGSEPVAAHLIHYGSNGSAECGAHGDGRVPDEHLTMTPSCVTCPTCRGWLPIVANWKPADPAEAHPLSPTDAHAYNLGFLAGAKRERAKKSADTAEQVQRITDLTAQLQGCRTALDGYGCIIAWALGQGDEFPLPPSTVTGTPKYWWRAELRRRVNEVIAKTAGLATIPAPSESQTS